MNSHLNTETHYHISTFSNAPFHKDNTRVCFQNTFASPLVLPDNEYKIGLKYVSMDFNVYESDVHTKILNTDLPILDIVLTTEYQRKSNFRPNPNTPLQLIPSYFNSDIHTMSTFTKKLNKLFKALIRYDAYSDQKRAFFSCVENVDGSNTIQIRIGTDIAKSIAFSEPLINLLNLGNKIYNHKDWQKDKYTHYWRYFLTKLAFLNPKRKIDFTMNSVVKKQLVQNNLPKLIFVKVDQISSTVNLGQFEKVIAMIPISKDNLVKKYSFLKYENLQCSLHNIQLSQHLELQKLKITLENEKGQQLHLKPGQATYVQFLIQKTMTENNILRISSETTDLFPNNTASEFQINLSHLLNMNYHDYEMGFHSIFIPKIVTLSDDVKTQFYMTLNYLNKDYKITLNNIDKHCDTLDNVLKYIKKESKKQTPIEFTFIPNALESQYIEISLNRHKREKISGKDKIKIETSPLLWYTLTNISKLENVLVYHNIKLTSYSYDDFLSVEEDVLFDFNFKDRLTPHTCAIYCDAITPHITGELYGQILQCIPIDVILTMKQSNNTKQIAENKELDSQDDYYFYKPQEISYYSLCQLLNMHFILKTLDGNSIKFHNSTLKTYINVMLKRKQIK